MNAATRTQFIEDLLAGAETWADDDASWMKAIEIMETEGPRLGRSTAWKKACTVGRESLAVEGASVRWAALQGSLALSFANQS